MYFRYMGVVEESGWRSFLWNTLTHIFHYVVYFAGGVCLWAHHDEKKCSVKEKKRRGQLQRRRRHCDVQRIIL